MFDFLNDMVRGAGKMIGTVTGTVLGVPLIVIAEALGMTTAMVKEAMDSGCKTYEEIRNFHKRGY